MTEFNDWQDLSGNIKLRLPKSLHGVLIRQSKAEDVSLNQLCLMYLSRGVSQNNLGADEFNHRLELIALECNDDEEKLFEKLGELNDEVEALKPRLLQELKDAMDDNKRRMGDFIEVLRYIYPIYHGDMSGEKLPMLKIPSAKISLRVTDETLLDLKEIETLVYNVCPQAHVANGDFDYYMPMDLRTSDKANIFSIAIHICCSYQNLEDSVRKIQSALEQSKQKSKFDVVVKPCYLQENTRILMEERYGSVGVQKKFYNASTRVI